MIKIILILCSGISLTISRKLPLKRLQTRQSFSKRPKRSEPNKKRRKMKVIKAAMMMKRRRKSNWTKMVQMEKCVKEGRLTLLHSPSGSRP